MKLIIAGATGFVATEVIRQSLTNPRITSVIALARRPAPTPANVDPGADTSKLHNVTIKDYDSYSDEVKKHFVGADACIWYTFIFHSLLSFPPPVQSLRNLCMNLLKRNLLKN